MPDTMSLLESAKADREEWKVRAELAAAFRLGERFGWTELVWNHITARVPGHSDHFLINPLGLRWGEICASNLLKVDHDGCLISGEGLVPKAGFVIHSAIHKAREEVHACVHTHTNDGIAVSAIEDGLLPLCHEALFFHENIGYFDDCGAAMSVNEREGIVQSLGENEALILRNHGLLTTGANVGEAFVSMYWLQRACEIQMKVLASQRPWRLVPETICKKFVKQKKTPREKSEAFRPGEYEWPALIRQLEKEEPDYKL